MIAINLDILKKFFSKEPIVKAWLFGSFARGEERADSDVDILVQFDRDAKVGLLRHADILLRLEQLLHRKVDLVPENSIYPELRQSINSSKILIYERN